MDRIYIIDFKKLVANLIPTFMNKGVVKVMQIFSSGLRSLHLIFLSMRNDHNKDLAVTPQVFSIRKTLNDYFDAGDRSIRIEDSNLHPRTYVFTEGEQQPVFLGERPIFTSAELRFATGFVVIAPEVLNNVAEDARMKAMINKYKLAGTKYTIRYE